MSWLWYHFTAAERIGGQRGVEELVAGLKQLLILERCDDTAGNRCHLLGWRARRAGRVNAAAARGDRNLI